MATVAELFGEIIIPTDRDLTPPGKRRWRIVQCTRAKVLRFYVAGRIFRQLPVSVQNIELAAQWVAAEALRNEAC